jgi:hypothetical protein
VPVKNDEEFRVWLEGQPQEICTAIAYRAAMRALPLAALWRDRGEIGSRFALAAFRTSLISGVAAGEPAHDVKAAVYDAAGAADAAASAGHAANAAANAVTRAVARTADAATYAAGVAAARAARTAADATNAADSAVDAADAAASAVARAAARTPVARAARAVARDAASAAAYADTDLTSDAIMCSAIAVPLEVLDAIEAHAVGKTDILRAGGPWTFWAKWYDRAMAGDPLPWDLQEQIALIPNEIWEAGPEAVAEEIEKLSFQFATSIAPRLVRDDEADVFRVEADPVPPEELAAFACQRAEMALDAALASVSENIFNERSYEVIVLRNTLVADRTVSLLAVGFYDACLGLNRNIGDRYPDEVALVNLQNALAGIVEELCALDDLARERCARLAGYNPEKTVQDLDRAELESIPALVGPDLDEKAQSIVESDIERLLSREATLPKWRRMRLTNWLTTISIYWDRTKKGYKEAKALSDMVTKLREWGRSAWDFLNGGGA